MVKIAGGVVHIKKWLGGYLVDAFWFEVEEI